ncbi:AraC family transcriptional regulator [Jidongwangia harbinensis]|uniref:AraC family transcriptional regulator n=1 Tax=Jidongwangia harbinensis TaxID=2878561 RepID=UPI001CDA0F21|nr:helix-turn-helix domain-containing protein [Jidongwangia harbinensis]MCA2214753.1 helix-turn-helix domain-containing protein [Jidongwangia harbinensis]
MEVNEYVRARPAPALRRYVAYYSGYRQRGLPPAVHRGLPSPYLTLILTLDEPLVVTAHPDPGQAPGRYDALLGGLHLTPALITHDGRQSGVQVAVHPLGCRALFGLPAGELGGLDTDLAAVLGDAPVRRLRAALHDADTWAGRFARIDRVLLDTLAERAGTVHPDVAYAFDRVLHSGGTVTVARLAAEVGWSTRHLTNRFRTEVGLRVKEAARVVRFDRARRRLTRAVRLGDVAAATGYFDQAHLAREFRALAGVPPSRWLADEFGFVQAGLLAGDDDGPHD